MKSSAAKEITAAGRVMTLKTPSGLGFRWWPCSGAYDLLWGETYLLQGVRPEVLLESGTALGVGRTGDLEVRVELETVAPGGAGPPGVLVSLALTNHGRRAVRVASFRLLAAARPGGRSLFRTGWQSWSHAGRLPLGSPDPDAAGQWSGPRHGQPSGGPTVASDWLAVLDGHPWLALGFITGSEQFGRIEIAPAGAGPDPGASDGGPPLVRLEAHSLADGRPLEPGGTLFSETLAVLAGEGSPWPALEALAAETGRRVGDLGPASGSPPRPPDPPTGWCSWYHYFHGLSEEVVLENLDRLARLGPGLPLRVFQIDDGYQAAVGRWLETNPRFPRGMKWLAGRIRETGFEPGLWLAPFTVMAGTPAHDDHPDWLLRDDDGRPVQAGVNWGGPFYGLDVTHPEVETHLRRLFRTVVRDWGYRYLKLDFIYCAALPGRRRDSRVTRAGAFRRALEIVREEVPEAYILACGSPLLPAVGLVDAMRIGPDVAPYWTPPPPLDADPSFPAALHSLRNVFARAFTHGRVFTNDPDCLLVRDRDTLLSLDEVRTLATGLACSGGSLFLSDGLSGLSEERLDIVRRLLPPSNRACRPVDPLGEDLPSAVVVPPAGGPPPEGDGRPKADAAPGGRTLTVALFNWLGEAEGEERRVDLARVLRATGLGPPEPDETESELAWHVFDFWRGAYVGRVTEDVGVVTLPGLPGHGCAVLGLVEHRRNVPMVVGCDRHLVQGPPYVLERREDGGRRLSVRVTPGGLETVRLWVAVPVGFRLSRAEPDLAPASRSVKVWGEILLYEVPAGPDGTELTLHFDRSEVSWTRPTAHAD